MNMQRVTKRSACLICTLSLLIGCGPQQDGVERYTEDGIEVVLNHLEPYSLGGVKNLVLEETLIIDTEMDTTAELGLTDITHMDVDSEGYIFIVNPRGGEKFIYKFDVEGSFDFAFGAKGQGPGELQNPIQLVISDRDEIVVTDREKVVVFSPTGQLIEEFRKDGDYQNIIPLDDERYLAIKVELNQDLSQTMSAVICSSELKEIKTLESSKIASFVGGTRVNIIPTLVHWAKSSRHVYTGNTDEYEIRVFDFNGELIRRIRKEFKAVLLSEEDKEEYKTLIQKYPPDIKESFFIPDEYPPFRRIVPHEEEWLFVQTYEMRSEGCYVYDMFNSGGIFIGRTELEGSLVKCKRDSLYCLREKDSGYKELVVYKMKWE
jgi:hypothetical protein